MTPLHSRLSQNNILLFDGALIVSCQALPQDPFDNEDGIVALAQSAEIGGASALRIASIENVKAVRKATNLPIIGIVKHEDRSQAYITPTLEDAQCLELAGADMIATDATDRPRPEGGTPELHLKNLKNKIKVPLMADIATFDEGVKAFKSGADFVATTLSGYTNSRSNTAPSDRIPFEPDLELVRRLSSHGRVIAEGRINTPEDVTKAFQSGAYAVVVGRAITRPIDITRRFVMAAQTASHTP